MKTEKIGTSYRVRPMRDGKRYCLTFDHKPTKGDIETALMDAIQREKQSKGVDVTFKQACKLYNDSKKNVLSASTHRDYLKLARNIKAWFLELKIEDITQDDINKLVNELALDKSPKTVRNYHGYISAVLGVYRPSLNISTKLPQKRRNRLYTPSESDVKKVLDASKGTAYELALKVLCYGLRRSELCAVSGDDIQGNILHIHATKVLNSEKKWIIQERTKTSESNRYIPISQDIADQIKQQGYVYNGHPNNISKYLCETEKKLGLPHFSAHSFRHFFASRLSQMNVCDADILQLGGWSTDYVMKEHYRESLQNEEEKRQRLQELTSTLF